MTAQDEFEAFSKGPFDAFMVAHGFVRSGRAWYRQVDGNWAGLGLQGNRYNDAGCCEFLINMGVTNRRVDRYHGLCTPRAKPVGFSSAPTDFLIDVQGKGAKRGSNTWWTVAESESLLKYIEEAVLPWYPPRLEDRSLATMFAGNRYSGLREQAASAILFQALGDTAARDEALSAMFRSYDGPLPAVKKRFEDDNRFLAAVLGTVRETFHRRATDSVMGSRAEVILYDGTHGHEWHPWIDWRHGWRLDGRIELHEVGGTKVKSGRLRIRVENLILAEFGNRDAGEARKVLPSDPARDGRELLHEHLGGEVLEFVYRFPPEEPDPLLFGLPAIGKLAPPPAPDVARLGRVRLMLGEDVGA